MEITMSTEAFQKFQSPINQSHPIQNSHFILLIQAFVLSSNQLSGSSTASKMSRIYAEDLGFKSWQEQ
jgi:hypothetical protein